MQRSTNVFRPIWKCEHFQHKHRCLAEKSGEFWLRKVNLIGTSHVLWGLAACFVLWKCCAHACHSTIATWHLAVNYCDWTWWIDRNFQPQQLCETAVVRLPVAYCSGRIAALLHQMWNKCACSCTTLTGRELLSILLLYHLTLWGSIFCQMRPTRVGFFLLLI